MPRMLAKKILLDHTEAEGVSPAEVVMVRCELVV